MSGKRAMKRFDKEAKEWDSSLRRQALAKAVVDNLSKYLTKEDKVLDFGCGTGLVGLNLAPFVKEVVGIDTSKEMVKIFNEKSKNLNLNAKAFVLDIFEIEDRFDAVVSSMTFHHIKDIKSLAKKLKDITDRIFIADLFKEDGTFHDRGNEDVFHFGFSKEDICEIFEGFKVDYKIIHTVKKKRDYPIFLAAITKSKDKK